MGEHYFDKVYGSLLGLAMGDAIGFPAMYHRTLLLRWGRGTLWKFSQLADENRVNKISLPFTLSQSEEHLHISGTDDSEFAVLSALILQEAGENVSPEALFDGWKKYLIDHADDVWSGVSERASIENAKKGLIPPATGNDNPHHFDDGAVIRAVPIGLRYKGQPAKAAEVAGWMAAITNAEDGVFAAQAMAASVSVAVEGASVEEVVTAGLQFIPDDSWLSRKIRQALNLLEQSGSVFAAIPLWSNHVVNGIYNYGNIAPETLALAYAILMGTHGSLLEGLQSASLIPKQADTMPAMVGALSGALQGTSSIPSTWIDSLDVLKGICIPSLKGISLKSVAVNLATL
ncbi:ADP-ribosylglycohydrolase family protein [Alicyclobacillus fastidiosus]|uniref:ADP-ribosylglycohydrolase family protein n=1 Tax=Alicyclobacillus fastidiosus TaxID=392011 RepID=A0ABV5AM21_9BACL|nr:ADP-ribosylglycohydrolase family protein [Alicyclobacillus fastidiosus]WEH08306.1 ADP-ribosylglycohydrolase family protein [Alicyclobacillus fastidiosus]